jgi:prolyl 4-hydroxylase
MNKKNLDDERIFLIEDFLSPEECDELIKLCESKGFEEATIIRGEVMMDKNTRNNDRLFYDSPELADKLFNRAKGFIVGDPIRFNERWRFYRYKEGQKFKKHTDMPYKVDDEVSYYTFMIYLNDDFKGGATSFHSNDEYGFCEEYVLPKKGTALVFSHWKLHEGNEVTEGCKYVLRTDVMFKKK